MIGASATQIQRQLGAGERQLLGIPMASRCFGAEAFVNKYIFPGGELLGRCGICWFSMYLLMVFRGRHFVSKFQNFRMSIGFVYSCLKWILELKIQQLGRTCAVI